jgi:hypothetical protein
LSQESPGPAFATEVVVVADAASVTPTVSLPVAFSGDRGQVPGELMFHPARGTHTDSRIASTPRSSSVAAISARYTAFMATTVLGR